MWRFHRHDSCPISLRKAHVKRITVPCRDGWTMPAWWAGQCSPRSLVYILGSLVFSLVSHSSSSWWFRELWRSVNSSLIRKHACCCCWSVCLCWWWHVLLFLFGLRNGILPEALQPLTYVWFFPFFLLHGPPPPLLLLLVSHLDDLPLGVKRMRSMQQPRRNKAT